MKKKIVLLFISVLLLSSVVLFTFTACGHRDICSYKEGTYRFDKDNYIPYGTDDTPESFDEIPDKYLLLHENYNLHVEDVALTFTKIGLVEYNRADGKNVVKNSKDLKKYHVDLYIKFAEEESGRVYDFVFDGSTFFQHCLITNLKNENLGLDTEFKFTIELVSDDSNNARIRFLWFVDAPNNSDSKCICLPLRIEYK